MVFPSAAHIVPVAYQLNWFHKFLGALRLLLRSTMELALGCDRFLGHFFPPIIEPPTRRTGERATTLALVLTDSGTDLLEWPPQEQSSRPMSRGGIGFFI